MPSSNAVLRTAKRLHQGAPSLTRIRDRTVEIWQVAQHEFYTGHDETHADRVLVLLDRLTSGCTLALGEAYVLAAATYLHDIGMQVQRSGRAPEEVRDIHEELGAQWVARSVRPDAARDDDLGVLNSYGKAIAQVIRGHRAKRFDGPEYSTIPIGSDQIRIAFLSALLQLADELDLDKQRVAMGRLRFVDVPLESQVHWYRHNFIPAVVVEARQGVIQVHFGFPPGREEEYERLIALPIHTILLRKITYLEGELASNGVRFRLVRPNVNADSTAGELPLDVLAELQRAATLDRIAQRDRQLSEVHAAQRDIDTLVRDQLAEARRRRDAGNPVAAAEVFEAVAQAHDQRGYNAGAALYYEQAAELLAGAGDNPRALSGFLLAARAHLASTMHVALAAQLAMRAHTLVAQMPEVMAEELRLKTIAQARVAVIQGQIARLAGRTAEAIQHFHVAAGPLEGEDDSTWTLIQGELAAALAAVERWNEAIVVLERSLGRLSDARYRTPVLLQLCRILVHLGRASAAESHLNELSNIAAASEDPALRSAIEVLNADRAVLAIDVEAASAAYNRAMDVIAVLHEPSRVASVLRQKKLVELRDGMRVGGPGFTQGAMEDLDRAIDLVQDGAAPLDQAWRLDFRAFQAFTDGNGDAALLDYNQAADLYWQCGAANEHEIAECAVARLYEASGRLDLAIIRYARWARTKDIERIALRLSDHHEAIGALAPILVGILVAQTDPARVGRAAVYGVLWDVLTDADVTAAVGDLCTLLSGTDSPESRRAVQGTAAQALGALAARLSTKHATQAAEGLLALLTGVHWWNTTRLAILSLGQILERHGSVMPTKLAAQLVAVLLEQARTGFEPQRLPALSTLVKAAHAGMPTSRKKILEHLQTLGDNPTAAAYRVHLGGPLSPMQLASVCQALLKGMNVQVAWTPSQVTRTPGQFNPATLRAFQDLLDADGSAQVVQGLAATASNPEEYLRLRGLALHEIGVFADKLSPRKAGLVLGTCLELLARVEIDTAIAQAHQAGADPMSAFEHSEGDRFFIVTGALWAVARLSNRVNAPRRRACRIAFIAAASTNLRSQASRVRFMIAHAIRALQGLRPSEHDGLAPIVFVLLHDHDPEVRAEAVRTAAALYAHRAPHWKDVLLLPILELGTADPSVVTQLSVAEVLDRLPCGSDAAIPEDVERVRARLRGSPSYQVRSSILPPAMGS